MDGSRFDTLTRSLGTASSRRRALGGLLTGVFGVLGWPGQEDAIAHDLKAKCKKKSGEAKKKCLKKAKKHAAQHATETAPGTTTTPPPAPPFCATQPNGSLCGFCRRCQDGSCAPDPTQNDASCNGTGRCLNGVCNPRPTCGRLITPCAVSGVDPSCCSGLCIISPFGAAVCSQVASGDACYGNDLVETLVGPIHECASASCVGYRCT